MQIRNTNGLNKIRLCFKFSFLVLAIEKFRINIKFGKENQKSFFYFIQHFWSDQEKYLNYIIFEAPSPIIQRRIELKFGKKFHFDI